jgi:anaerobic magnesium-protoporphyrin IX monomethyl ester cyclase
MKNSLPRTHTLLVAPPVWTPIYPYLALPVLAGYLRRKGCSISQFDASLVFFLDYLLGPSGLGFPEREALDKTREALSALRDPKAFFDPHQVISSLQHLRQALQLASRQYRPATIGFNRFVCPEISSVQQMLDFCDSGDNPFLPLCKDHLSTRMKEEAPCIVGISLSTPYQLHASLTMGRFIKKAFPQAHVVLGGKYCQALHEHFVQEPSMFGALFDSLIPHQGEGPLLALIQAISSRSGIQGVPGLTFLLDGAVRVNPPPVPYPLEGLPMPDFSDYKLKQYLVPRPYLSLRLADGCYWGRCTFCSRYGRQRTDILPARLAVDQVEALARAHGASDISINDDCLPPAYLEQFCKEILRRGLDLSLQLFGKPTKGFTRRRLEILSRAGVREIRWGIESANRRILGLMNKGTDPDGALRVLEDGAHCGIWNHACMILGFPSESQEEAEESLTWIRKNRNVIHSCFLFEFHLSEQSYISRHPQAFSINGIAPAQGPFSNVARFSTSSGMSRQAVSEVISAAKKELRENIYCHPFWYYLRDREYLQLYLHGFGLQKVRGMHVNPLDFTVTSS